MYTRVSITPTSVSVSVSAFTSAFTSVSVSTSVSTSTTKELTMRVNPSDILFLVLSGLVLLLAAFTLGGLAAHPFAG